MKYADLKVGMRVYDRHYCWILYGKVISIMKTRVILLQGMKLIKYDRAHVQFLEPSK